MDAGRHRDLTWRSKDGLRLFAQSWEPAVAPVAVVCLVHGFGEHSGRYTHVAGALTGAGFAVLAFDLRGNGRSEGRRGHIPSYDALLDDVDLLLAEAAQRWPDCPHFLYGHSFGGGLVLYYTLRRRPPIAGVIATSPWLRLAFAPPAWKEALAGPLARLWPAFTLDNELDARDLSHDPAVATTYQRDPLVHSRVSARAYASARDAGAWALAHAAEFPVPLLLMHGTADRITSSRASVEFAAKLPGACDLKLWEGCSHELHNELRREEVLATIVAWLRAHV